MPDPIDSLLVDVRANTQSFAQDVAQMRANFDATLVDGFARAGSVLERSLVGALRHGSLGFADLRRTALAVLDTIALRAARGLFGSDQAEPGRAGALPAAAGVFLAGLLGLPGRGTGGPVAPGRGYLVGERGPELFLPTSAGRIEPLAPAGRSGREVRVAITINAPAGTGAGQALHLSTRQIAGAVRRALRDA